jgi:hypothetical protein
LARRLLTGENKNSNKLKKYLDKIQGHDTFFLSTEVELIFES